MEKRKILHESHVTGNATKQTFIIIALGFTRENTGKTFKHRQAKYFNVSIQHTTRKTISVECRKYKHNK